YTFKVGNQKPTVDISDFTKVNDSVEFNKQLNIYTFTVPYDGRYRFEFSGMLSGTMVDIYVENYLGETVEYRYGCKNGQGVTAKGLTAGDTYTAYVIQNSGFSSYSLMIGHQKPIVEVKNNSTIADSIEYIDQRNVYSFTNTKSGDVVISISDMLSDVQVQICVFNDLFEVIADDSYIRNGNYVVIRNATPGSHYEIQVRQNRGFSSYKLNID
ncbi:MAG: hypothetical protein GX860_10340, partial [Alcaligenaceae bacterium]|nr:hypothetical protein [Alcaligenaceae bacterium]